MIHPPISQPKVLEQALDGRILPWSSHVAHCRILPPPPVPCVLSVPRETIRDQIVSSEHHSSNSSASNTGDGALAPTNREAQTPPRSFKKPRTEREGIHRSTEKGKQEPGA